MFSSEGFLKRTSSIPSVPVNYKCSKQQKTGKSYIPRFMTIYSKQVKDTIGYYGLKKDNARSRDSISYSPTIYSEPLEIESSPKTTKKVQPSLQEKSRQNGVSLPLSEKSKIPVSTLTKKTSVSSLLTKKTSVSSLLTKKTSVSSLLTKKTSVSSLSTKKEIPKTRTSHRNCTSCASSHNRVNSIKNTVNNVKNTVKRKSSRVLRCKDSQDNLDNKDDDTSSCSSTPTSTKKPLRKLSQNFFKKRVSPLQPSTLTKSDDLSHTDTQKETNDLVLVCSPLTKSDDLLPTLDSHKETSDLVLVCSPPTLSPTLSKSDDLSPISLKETNDLVISPTLTKSDDLTPPTFDLYKETNDLVLVCTPLIKTDDLSPTFDSHKETIISLKIKHISYQKSVNKPEASISITHSNVEVSTTTSIIKPEPTPISKTEKDFSDIKPQSNEDSEVAPTLVNNVCKKIVRFSKFISKIKSLV